MLLPRLSAGFSFSVLQLCFIMPHSSSPRWNDLRFDEFGDLYCYLPDLGPDDDWVPVSYGPQVPPGFYDRVPTEGPVF